MLILLTAISVLLGLASLAHELRRLRQAVLRVHRRPPDGEGLDPDKARRIEDELTIPRNFVLGCVDRRA